MVWGLGFRVWGFGFRVGFRVEALGFRAALPCPTPTLSYPTHNRGEETVHAEVRCLSFLKRSNESGLDLLTCSKSAQQRCLHHASTRVQHTYTRVQHTHIGRKSASFGHL